ncbi:DUF1439 domain-containing protein, partial [Herbaspirillum sp. 3C11]
MIKTTTSLFNQRWRSLAGAALLACGALAAAGASQAAYNIWTNEYTVPKKDL